MQRYRRQLEQQESDALAPYATRSRDSRGRAHPEPEPRYRTAFQRDRDRIVHCAAFRALEYKTQVFVNDAGDYFRTRLTHTLEVAQIGRTLARALGVNEDLVEAICLAHDLGHPPFGHAGEGSLNQLIADSGGFNHNHQSYRVVTRLERRYPQWLGLNLTHETLDGIAKHETEYDFSGAPDIDPEAGPSIEAQIANIADELAYNAHDLDDGLQARLIRPAQLEALDLWRGVAERVGYSGGVLDEVTRHHIIRELVGGQVDDVLRQSARNLEAARPACPADVQRLGHNLISHSAGQSLRNRRLKDFLFENLYRHPRVARMQTSAEACLGALFGGYVDNPEKLPMAFQERLEREAAPRVIADYIAGLTDRSALLEYRQLSLLDAGGRQA